MAIVAGQKRRLAFLLELFDLFHHLAQKLVRDVFHFLAGVAFFL